MRDQIVYFTCKSDAIFLNGSLSHVNKYIVKLYRVIIEITNSVTMTTITERIKSCNTNIAM